MRPSFQPRLINEPFADPGLFIPFLHQRRALMFDLGDLSNLAPRDLVKITHVFVTHTHMDHFIGFDTLLRALLGREKILHLYGPGSFFKHVEGKLSGYTWNLVNEFENRFMIQVNEVHPEKIFTRNYICRDRFVSKAPALSRPFHGSLLAEPSFKVQAVLLDHRIPCLGLSLTENFYVNIIKEELKALRLPVGPWINRFKAAIYQGMDSASDFVVTWEDSGHVTKEKSFKLGALIRRIARISPGQKIAYVTDVLGDAENAKKIVELAQGASRFFVEAAFLDSQKEIAKRKYHLTAREAGDLAGRACVKHFDLFHFSPRNQGRATELEREAGEAYKTARSQSKIQNSL
ncbi:MAG: MBL fold metallo-hydrolase [Desulfatiglandaceae bacterium]